MLQPCEKCGRESIHGICMESANQNPIGKFWFCSYECLYKWLTGTVARKKETKCLSL